MRITGKAIEKMAAGFPDMGNVIDIAEANNDDFEEIIVEIAREARNYLKKEMTTPVISREIVDKGKNFIIPDYCFLGENNPFVRKEAMKIVIAVLKKSGFTANSNPEKNIWEITIPPR